MGTFFITGIGKLALPQPSSSGLPSEPVTVIEDVWTQIADDRIVRIGPEGEPEPRGGQQERTFNARGMLATPGLVDAHTHPVFAAGRQGEFVRRIRGESYQQIAAAGGGIRASLKGVREASPARLTELTARRLTRFIELGTTTIEAKSGYGLTVEDELKSLRALKAAATGHPLEVSPTLLGAHVVPPEFQGQPDRYVDLVVGEMIPRAAGEKLAEAVDLFLEEGAFNLDQARRILEAGRNAGLNLRLHADQFSAGGGARLAAELGALTAEHMDYTDEDGLRALAAAGVTVVLLPGAVFFLGRERYAPARRMIDLGCRVALSTDFNPGSSPTQSLPLMMTLACLKMGLTPSEALWAATMGGAYGVGRADRVGTLLPGYQADICLWDTEDLESIPYLYGCLVPEAVFKKGRLVARRGNMVADEQQSHPSAEG